MKRMSILIYLFIHTRKTLEQEIDRTLWTFAAEENGNDSEMGVLFSEVVKEHSELALTRQNTIDGMGEKERKKKRKMGSLQIPFVERIERYGKRYFS